jgi:hypothetical protein
LNLTQALFASRPGCMGTASHSPKLCELPDNPYRN